METVIKGYDKDNKVVITKIVDYNDRYDAIHAVMNSENVTHITANTKMTKSV